MQSLIPFLAEDLLTMVVGSVTGGLSFSEVSQWGQLLFQ